jgi:small-conductance mechanosensitive channel
MVGGVAALWLYAYFKVASALIEFMLWIWPLRRLQLVQNHRERLVILVQRGLTWLVVFGWWVRLLDYLGLLEGARIGIEGALDARLTLGAFSTSAGEVLAFAITLWVAYLLSVALRFVLEEDVYPRIGISKGISYASTSLLRYTIGLLAIFIGLGFLGVTLTQVTVFAGALGVGVGFGLQGVVQNFVAGLILLFEQPIHVGDAVQIGELQGRVRRIGIRASLVHTVQGADVIIPNSQLTAKQVTNWTLTDQRRRLDLAVSVCPGSQPHQAIELLEGVALAHPMVLHDPPPRCLFLSYSENAIDFELRVWADYDIATDVRSALMTAVYEAVYAAGMGFSDSPREVLLVNEGSSMRLKPAEA